MKEINDKTSFKITLNTFDSNKLPITPDVMTYTITQKATGDLIRTATITPISSTTILPITVADNTLDADINVEERSVSIEWTYDSTSEGDHVYYYYRIIKG